MMKIGFQPVIRTTGAQHSRWRAWARAARGRQARFLARIIPAAMELVYLGGRSGARVQLNRIGSPQFHSRLTMAWHLHQHSAPALRTIHRTAWVTQPAPPVLSGDGVPIQSIQSSTVFRQQQLRTAATLVRMVTLSTTAGLLIARSERLLTQAPPARSVLSQFAVVASLPRIIAAHGRRVEDPQPLRTFDVARAPVPARTAAAAPVPVAAPVQPAPIHREEAVETVHVAPRLKAAAPTVNIDQIADQVIRQIDSRVIAWRERMGRIN